MPKILLQNQMNRRMAKPEKDPAKRVKHMLRREDRSEPSREKRPPCADVFYGAVECSGQLGGPHFISNDSRIGGNAWDGKDWTRSQAGERVSKDFV
ncbi:hypothetical protein [Paraburkholderia caffeinilytica]|uniref:hypothetical protein n=1 Tax=Paraburkholderia caffeinilytica TaxID=1761016 RepID=UPI003DA0364A